MPGSVTHIGRSDVPGIGGILGHDLEQPPVDRIIAWDMGHGTKQMCLINRFQTGPVHSSGRRQTI